MSSSSRQIQELLQLELSVAFLPLQEANQVGAVEVILLLTAGFAALERQPRPEVRVQCSQPYAELRLELLLVLLPTKVLISAN